MRQIARDAYSNTPTGVLGNEDCGQMSAWYIFTAIGFYPVNPASAQYMIGSPLFTRATLNLPNGKRFEISAVHNSAAQSLHSIRPAEWQGAGATRSSRINRSSRAASWNL